METRRALIFWTATGLIGAETLLFTMVAPALPVFAERFGFGAPVAALVFAAFPVGQLVSALASAGPSERFGRRPVLAAGALALALATLAFALASATWMLAAARLAQGVAAGMVWTAGLAAITDAYPADELGLRLGLAETAGGALGLLGPVVGGALVDAMGTRSTFLLATLVPALAVVPVLAMPETAAGVTGGPPLLTAVRRLLRRPKARAAAASLGAVAAVLAMVEPLLPLDLASRLGLSSLGIGLVFAVGDVAYLGLVPFAGRWSDRHGRRTPLVAGGVVLAAGLPFLAVGPAWWVALAFVVVGAGMASLGTPAGPLMVEAVEEAGMAGRHGLSSAMLNVVFALGYAAGPLLGATASAALPFGAVMAIAAAGALALAVGLARSLPREGPGVRGLAPGPRGPQGPR